MVMTVVISKTPWNWRVAKMVANGPRSGWESTAQYTGAPVCPWESPQNARAITVTAPKGVGVATEDGDLRRTAALFYRPTPLDAEATTSGQSSPYLVTPPIAPLLDHSATPGVL